MDLRAVSAAMLVVLTVALLSTPAEARLTNVVTDWINATQAAVATAGIQNQLSAKYYGLVGLAAHAAIVKGGAPPAALAAYASHTILSASFPWRQGPYDVLISKQLANFNDANSKAAKEVAVPIAVKLFKDRAADESIRWARFKPAAPGTQYVYQYTTTPAQTYSLYPQLANTTPFVADVAYLDAIVNNTDKENGPVFQPPKDDYKRTYEYGAKNSAKRKQYDTDSAFFWADGANTSAITGHFIDIAREVLPEDLSNEDTALFFARFGAAIYDASIAGWKVKYGTLHWRPITAFTQGYPGFTADPSRKPLLPTPSHPEYPSGHQVSVGAAAEVLTRTLGRDQVSFSIASEGAPWLGKRNYTSITQAANEVGDSRLYAGLHFPSANANDQQLGRLVGGKAFDNYSASKFIGGGDAASGAQPSYQLLAGANITGAKPAGRKLF